MDGDYYITNLHGLASTCEFGDRDDEMMRDELFEESSTPQLYEGFLLEVLLSL